MKLISNEFKYSLETAPSFVNLSPFILARNFYLQLVVALWLCAETACHCRQHCRRGVNGAATVQSQNVNTACQLQCKISSVCFAAKNSANYFQTKHHLPSTRLITLYAASKEAPLDWH